MIEQRVDKITDPSGGSNQRRVRDYNERLVLSLVRRHGSLAKSDIARRSGLSAQTITVIMRSLEKDGLLLRGEPVRGKVGQPSIPMRLDPNGVFSLGLKIGRRSADLTLVDFLGRERKTITQSYAYPTPVEVLRFADAGISELATTIPEKRRNRLAGIGVSIPFELWNWAEKVGAPKSEMESWRSFDLRSEIANVCNLPTFLQNDATAACGAELVFGRGAELTDFVYFFIGTFIGGGIVLNHSVYSGRSGNAGALGSMPVIDRNGHAFQLIDHASIFTLEAMLQDAGKDNSPIWLQPDDWSGFGTVLDDWISNTALHLAAAIVAACSVIDFGAAVVDGSFPSNVRSRLVAETIDELEKLDLQGINGPRVFEGVLGSRARALGGASQPLFARYLLDQNVLVNGGD